MKLFDEIRKNLHTISTTMDHCLKTRKPNEKKRQSESGNLAVVNHMSFLRHKCKVLDNLKTQKIQLKDQHTSTRKDMYQANVQVLLNADKDENIQQIYKNIFDMYKTEADESKTELDKVESEITRIQNEVNQLEVKRIKLQSPMVNDDSKK